jgi:hypothetical protein
MRDRLEENDPGYAESGKRRAARRWGKSSQVKPAPHNPALGIVPLMPMSA